MKNIYQRVIGSLVLVLGLAFSVGSKASDCVTQGDGINDKYDTDCDNDGKMTFTIRI